MSGSALPEGVSGFAVWRRFVVATTIGVIVAFTAFVALFTVIGEPSDVLLPVLMLGVGLIWGFFQQRALAKVLGAASGWAVATGVGLGLGYGLAVAVGLGDEAGLAQQVVQSAVAGAAAGAILGALQWRIIGRHVNRARWWVPVSIVGWAAGAALGAAAGYFDDGLDILIGPVAAAAVTGVALVALMRTCPPAPTAVLSGVAPAPTGRHQ